MHILKRAEHLLGDGSDGGLVEALWEAVAHDGGHTAACVVLVAWWKGVEGGMVKRMGRRGAEHCVTTGRAGGCGRGIGQRRSHSQVSKVRWGGKAAGQQRTPTCHQRHHEPQLIRFHEAAVEGQDIWVEAPRLHEPGFALWGGQQGEVGL